MKIIERECCLDSGQRCMLKSTFAYTRTAQPRTRSVTREQASQLLGFLRRALCTLDRALIFNAWFASTLLRLSCGLGLFS